MLSQILLESTLEGVLAAVPHDTGAVTVYVLLGVFLGFIWLGGRPRAPRDRTHAQRTDDD